MNDEVRTRLRELIRNYGVLLIQDESRCEALITNTLTDAKKELNLLLLAYRDKVPHELANVVGSDSTQQLIPQLAKRLSDSYGTQESLASWVVETWAEALGCGSSPAPLASLASEPARKSDSGVSSEAAVTITEFEDRFEGDTWGVKAISFSPNGQLVVAGAVQLFNKAGVPTLAIWDAHSGRLVQTLRRVGERVDIPFCFSPDGSFICSRPWDVEHEKSVQICDASSGRPMRTFVHPGPVTDAALSPNGRWIATACADGECKVRLWEISSGRLVRTMPSQGRMIWSGAATPMSVAFSSDGSRIASGHIDGK